MSSHRIGCLSLLESPSLSCPSARLSSGSLSAFTWPRYRFSMNLALTSSIEYTNNHSLSSIFFNYFFIRKLSSSKTFLRLKKKDVKFIFTLRKKIADFPGGYSVTMIPLATTVPTYDLSIGTILARSYNRRTVAYY